MTSDLVDLDSPGWLPYTEICGNSTLAWTMFLNLLPIVYCGWGWFVVLRSRPTHHSGACYWWDQPIWSRYPNVTDRQTDRQTT